MLVTAPFPQEETAVVASFHPPSSLAPLRGAYRLEAFGLSDVGRVREVNEDYAGLRPSLGLFAVADGIGGHAAGEVASRMAVESVCDAIERSHDLQPLERLSRARHPSGARLEGALQVAHRRILLAAQEDSRCTGMGTTFVGALFTPHRVAIAHVGDSRAYRLRGRRLEQLTDDHSLLNDHIRAGLFDPDAGVPFRYPSTITRAVGLDAELDVDVRMDAPAPGDVYLLCTDGLTGLVASPEIAGILLMERDLGRATRRLVRRANDLGGHDNITVVLVRVVDADVGASRPGAQRAN